MAILGGVIFLFITDRILKYIALNHWYNKKAIIIKDCLELELFKNPNIAFGIYLPSVLIIILAILIIAGLIYYLFILLSRQGYLMLKSGLFLIILGAISNLYDRLLYDNVIDYINIKDFPVFNLGDLMIDLGVVLIIITLFAQSKKSVKIKK